MQSEWKMSQKSDRKYVYPYKSSNLLVKVSERQI